METKTILLSEKEGKRYRLDIYQEDTKYFQWDYGEAETSGYKVIYHGSISDFLQLPNKEEIAEKVVDKGIIMGIPVYDDYEDNGMVRYSALDSLLSAIGDYKYFIITETET
jgi:hypothetical protein